MADLRGVLTAHYEQYGELVPRRVWEEARPVGAPLHHRFEWDDAKASDAYRDIQAAELIRSVRISFQNEGTGEVKSVRAFQAARDVGETSRGGYVPTEEVARSPIAAKLLLQSFMRDIASLKRKYGHMDEYLAWVEGEAQELAS